MEMYNDSNHINDLRPEIYQIFQRLASHPITRRYFGLAPLL